MDASYVNCEHDHRRADVRAAPLLGLDFVEVTEDQRGLEVFFLGRAPQQLKKANIRLAGGRRITNIGVTDLRVVRQQDLTLDDFLEVRLDKYGDFSTYTLSLVKLDESGRPTEQLMDGFDPRYATVEFSFKASCPTDEDCKAEPVCPPPRREQPEINYLAKDYLSFRQLILDRLALIMPDWRESHVPDIGIMLVELLAYMGDQLSYYQDAVATEAYLDTARQRISVRRHARLVDYAMHEGCNARTWITIAADRDGSLDPLQTYFCTAFPGSPAGHVLQPADMANVTPGRYVPFQPLVADPSRPIPIYAAHTEIHFYTWGDCACCLPAGTTAATLTDAWIKIAPAGAAADAPPPRSDASGEPPNTVRALKLAVGDLLIFEEVIGPKTGNPADADPRHRQAVRLTKVTPAIDRLYHPFSPDYGQPVLEIEWCPEDALTFPLCLSAMMPPPDCDCRAGISVARGNVILVGNSIPIGEPLGTVPSLPPVEQCATDCSPAEIVIAAEKFRPVLRQRPLSFSQPLPPCGCASRLIAQDPRQALPQITLTATAAVPPGADPNKWKPVPATWRPKRDLLESGPADRDFVVEMDDDGAAHSRFGNGYEGQRPEAGAAFTAHYGVGNGRSGNVGAGTIKYIAFRETTGGLGNLIPRNPLPAQGGTAPEPVTEVKMFAPHAFRGVRERAITADDYAALAGDNARRLAERPALLTAALAELPSDGAPPPGVHVDDPRAALEEEPGEPPLLGVDICAAPFRSLQACKGALRWTGSWYEADVAIDPLGSETADDELLTEIEAYLEPYRRVGHDLRVEGARYVGIDLALNVCVLPHYLRGHVETTLRQAFGARVLPDGSLGFFHPDNLGFGEGIYVSRIVAAAQGVAGVMEVRVARLARYHIGAPAADEDANELPAGAVLKLGAFEIARLDGDPSFPENGRFTLIMRGGR